MVDPHTNGCPEPEVLAAYVDRGLSLSERARVDAHLASCPQCIALVAGVVRTVAEVSAHAPGALVTTEPAPLVTWRAVAGAVAAAAAVIAVVSTPLILRPRIERDSGLVSLVESVGEQRSVLGRLTGGFPHAPLGVPSAGGQDGRPAGADRVQLTAGKIRESFGERQTPSQLHAVGLSQLLAGHYDDAAQALMAASREQPANAQYLSDVSAVQLERARLGLRPDDLPRALAAADRARRLDPSLREAWFNRALAASALSLTAEAKDAWGEYLKRDSASPWAAEARARLAELTKSTPAQAWAEMQGRLRDSFDQATADEAVKTQTTEARSLIENVLIVQWAHAVLAGDSGRSELERVRTMADALRRVAGDSLYADAVAAIDRASGASAVSLARVHQEYVEAAGAFAEDRFAAAAPALSAARDGFAKAGSSFAARAALDLAASQYFTGQAKEAASALEALGVSARNAGYANVASRVAWQQGLAAMGQGRLADAQNHFEETLAGFEGMGDAEQVANAHNLLASLYYYLGDKANEWQHRARALQGLSIAVNPRTRYGLIATAAASTRAENPEAALWMNDAALDAAREARRSAALTDALAQRSATKIALGRNREAAIDLDASRLELRNITDVQFRKRMEATLLSTESDLLRSTNPGGAVEAANRAIAIVKERGDRLRLAQLNLQLAQANIVRGRLEEAQTALNTGLKAFEDERLSLSDEGRISTLDESWRLYETAVHLAVKNHDYPRAFALSERARALTLAEARKMPAAYSLTAAETALGSDEAVLALNQFDDELAIWVIRRSGTSVALRPIGRHDAALFVSRQQQEISMAPATASASTILYDALIRPVASQLSGATRLVVVGDGPLRDAAFAGFFNKATRQFLVEDMSIVSAPSVFAFNVARSMAVSNRAVTDPLVLAGPNVTDVGARQVAAVYAQPEILTGVDATRDRFLAEAAGREVVHVQAATGNNRAYPLLSRVLLADEPGRKHSGAVLGSDIVARGLTGTKLVVIDDSASDRGEREADTMGMTRAFMVAGVPSVLTTVPGADESATRELFIGFHREVARGVAAVDALTRIQREVIRSNGRRIGAWSALVIYGSDR